MATNQPPPRLPEAPDEYNRQYIKDLIRDLMQSKDNK